MERQGKIGIIGAGGTVGRAAADYLETNHCVLRGGRHGASGENTFYVDVYEKDSLKAFCENCDVVINAAGPSYEIRDIAARAAVKSGAGYVDVFGGGQLERLLEDTFGSCIIGAGCVPGLSGILLRHLSEEKKEGERIVLCHGGEECGGISALKDIILSAVGNYGIPDKVLSGGRLCSRKTFGTVRENRPGFAAPVFGSPFFTEEDGKARQCYGISDLEEYQMYADEASKDLISDGCRKFLLIREEEERNVLCREILEKQRRLLAGRQSWFAMTAELKGPERTKRIEVKADDSSKITGLIAGICAEYLLRTKQRIRTKWAFQCLHPEEVFGILRQQGIEIREKEKSVSTIQMMKVGEI